MSSWWLFSALAIADCRHLRTSRAMRLRENSRSASAVATFLPRMSCASRLSFCGLTRSMRATALASVSARLRSRALLLITALLNPSVSARRRRRGASRRSAGPLGLAIGRMAVECPRRRELAEFVTDHLFRDYYRDVLLPVVDAEGQPDELRQDGRAPAPYLDQLVPARRTRLFGLFQQIAVDEWTLPNRSRHDLSFLLLLPRVAAGNDEFARGLVGAGLLALGREAPRRHRMAAARGTAFAAAVRVIDRVHRHAAVVGHAAHPTLAARLADRDVHVVRIGHRTDRGHAATVHQALLGRVQAHDHVVLVAPDDLRIGPGRAGDLPALAHLELDIVHDGADRDVAERHGIAWLHVHVLAGNDRVAGGEALRSQDIGELAVLVLDQRNKGGAIGIVFDALDLSRDIELAPLEIDAAVGLLMAAATEPHRDAPVVVAATCRALTLGQHLQRLAAIETGAVDLYQLTLARRNGVIGLECHFASPTGPSSRRSCDPPQGSRSRASPATAHRCCHAAP